jgi:hypothetical protein
MNLRVIKLLLICLFLALNSGCTFVYKAKNINKESTKITKKINIAVKQVDTDLASLNSLKRQLITQKELNQQALQLLEQKLPNLVELAKSAKQTEINVNKSQNKLRGLFKGHKKVTTNSQLGEKIEQQHEHKTQLASQLIDIHNQYADERKILTGELADQEVKQVSLVKTHKRAVKKLQKYKTQAVKKQKKIRELKQRLLKNNKDMTLEQRKSVEKKTAELTANIGLTIKKLNAVSNKYNALIKKYKNKKPAWSYPKNDIYNFQLYIEKTKIDFDQHQTELNTKLENWNQLMNSF